MHPTRRNLIVLLFVVVLVIAVAVPVASHMRRTSRLHTCTTQVRSVAQSAVFWAEAHKNHFPNPLNLDMPARERPTDAFALLVANRYFDAEIARCPSERNPAYLKTSSYAHDEVTRLSWTASPTVQVPALGDRGPKDGVHDPSSLTYLNHGSKRGWVGNIGMRDGSVLIWVQDPNDQNSFASRGPLNGVTRDNYFARDLPGPNPTDLFLAKRSLDANGNWTVTWD